MNDEIILNDGKYKIVVANGYEITVYRNGELWRDDFIGDGFMLALVARAIELEHENKILKSGE